MGIFQIFVFTLATFTTLILFCACKKIVRDILEKNKNKKRNNTVKPITETDENIKDEIKNEIRLPQLITNEDNV
jgi:predicted membrane protein